MQVRTLHHVNLLVNDLAEALAFYEGVLDLPVRTDRPADMPAGYWFDIGDRRLSIIPGKAKSASEQKGDLDGYHFALVIEDIDSTLADLEQKKIPLTIRRNPLLQIMLQDPSGNWIELRQPPEAYLAHLESEGSRT